MPPLTEERTSRTEALRAGLYALILLWINTYIARDLFYGSSAHMGSMHGFWTAIAARAGSSWFRATWWPFWEMGIPFEYTYPPLVPALAAAIAWMRGVPAEVGYQSVTGLVYILGPLTLFFAGWRLTRAPGASFGAALGYSLTAITQVLLPDADFAWKNFWEARRLFVVTVWDDTPHVAALVLLPLFVLCLARSLERRRPIYYAGAALCVGGAALASAFGPVMVVLAAVCVLCAMPRERRLGDLILTGAIGFWGWAIAAPFLSPSFLKIIQEANAAQDGGGVLGSITALAFTVSGALLVNYGVGRWTGDRPVRLFVVFAWVAASIPLGQAVLQRHYLPQPNRYKFEMELALWPALIFAALPAWNRIPLPVRRAVTIFVLALAAEQVAEYRHMEKKFSFPFDAKDTVEYRAAVWAQRNFPQIRFFMPGSIAQWTNTFTDIQQFTGESFTIAANQVQQRADTMIAFGTDDLLAENRKTLAWLKACGVGVIAISSKTSKEYWHGFTHPEKFQSTLPVLWSEDGVTMYRVPLREFTLAHVVQESAIVRGVPKEPDDTEEVERFAASLDDPSLPGTAFDWEGRNRIRIHTNAAPGYALTIQVTHHPGWHATIAGKPQSIFKDGLGLMWMRPACTGPCEVVLDYDGGWELRLCRWLSWASLAAVAWVAFRYVRGAGLKPRAG